MGTFSFSVHIYIWTGQILKKCVKIYVKLRIEESDKHRAKAMCEAV